VPIYKKVNKNFFKKWTPEMAYVLGFFAADGYMTINKRGAHFWNIQVNDKELLKEIKKSIKSEHKISVKIRKRKEEKTSYRLQIGSKEMYEDLYKLGMRQNKTKSLTIPNVPDKYFSHFVRGYFDGDGHVWSGLIHKKRKTQTLIIRTVFTSCSKMFLQIIREKLEENNIQKGVLSEGKGNYYRLVYSVFGSLNLYNFMYNTLGSSKLFLGRKKAIFERYKKLRL
jgi:intein-encoded DNA endonuclease-like protein